MFKTFFNLVKDEFILIIFKAHCSFYKNVFTNEKAQNAHNSKLFKSGS